MRRYLRGLAAVLLACIFTACSTKTPIPDLDITLEDDISAEVIQESEGQTAKPDIGRETLAITWGCNPTVYGEQSLQMGFWRKKDDCPVFQYLNEKYQVEMSGWYIPNLYKENIELPDIFYTDPYRAYEEGMTRTIPREMIEKYAPDYAAVLSAESGWDINQTAKGDYRGLCTYDAYYDRLSMLSVYRLDWLEEIGVQPKGELLSVTDKIFFTQEPFTLVEYAQIMRDFASEGAVNKNVPEGITLTTKNYGLAVDLGMSPFEDSASIMGAWGVNNSIMEEEGRAVPYYATNAYKSGLMFLESLGKAGCISVYQSNKYHYSFCVTKNIGWACMRVNNIFSVAEEFLQYNAPGKLLITPPETQGFTKQGIGTAQSTQPFKADGAWVINQNVDDEKLARILTLFNDMAFDPETYVNMVYGIEGTHFNWSGQPYESKIVPIKNVYAPLILEGIQVFHTGIVDGKAGKREYNYDPNPVFDYINSYSAEQLNLWPYKEDYKGVLAAEKAALDDQYGETLREIVNTYYQRALEGVGEVASTWESYIAALHEAGLDDYIALYERY